MYIKRYTIAAFIWIGLVGWYVYAYISPDNMSINFFDIPLPPLKIAFWIVFPVVILYIGSVIHMTFYSIIGNFRLRKYAKDYEKIIDAVIDTYLGKKDRHYAFKTDRYKLLGTLLENSTIFPNGNISAKIKDTKIEKVLKVIEDVKSGEVVDLKPFNLSPSNELVIQNVRNKYKKGELKAEDILPNADKYTQDLCQEVYADYITTANLTSIEKYKEFLTKDYLHIILLRINASTNSLDISNEILISLFKQLELNAKDFIDLSIQLSKADMIPEQRIKLFETLSDENDEAMPAYLYTLLNLEMIAPAKAILENSQQGEYENFKAYLALKECGQLFNINLFI